MKRISDQLKQPNLSVEAQQSKLTTFLRRTGIFLLVMPLVGFSIGLFIDWQWPGEISWAMALFFLGIMLGCMSAWAWIKRS